MIVFLPLQSFAKAVVFYRKPEVGMNEPLVRPMLLVQHFSILFFNYLIGLCMSIFNILPRLFDQ